MRWVSVVTFVGAALLPAASARPPCRPNRPTTTLSATAMTTTTAAVVETLSTDTTAAEATSAVSSDTSALTSTLETTVTNSVTATLESTTLIPSTTATEADTGTMTDTTATTAANTATTTDVSTITEAATTTDVSTTAEAATTTTEAAAPINYVKNGDFETVPNTDWQVSAGEVKDDASKSRSPTHYAQFDVSNTRSSQVQYLFQVVRGLDTQRRYRLTAYSTVFSSPAPVSNTEDCVISATHSGGFPIAQFNIDFDNVDVYHPYIFEFTPFSPTGSLSIVLRCDPRAEYSFSVGIDDISLVDIGPDPSA